MKLGSKNVLQNRNEIIFWKSIKIIECELHVKKVSLLMNENYNSPIVLEIKNEKQTIR